MNHPRARAVLLIVCLLLPASAIAQVSLDATLAHDLTHVLGQISSPQDSIGLAETAALIRIVDSACYESAVKESRTPADFTNRLAECRTRHADIWPEIERRIGYARQRCATTMYEADPDVRWQLFLSLGPPTAEWSTPSDCIGDGQNSNCQTYIYSWSSPERDVTCQSSKDHDYPTRVIEGILRSDELNRPVYPMVQPLVFPRADSTYDVWLSVWIRGSDFTVMSLMDGITNLDMEIRDRNKNVIGGDLLAADLRLLRSVLAVTKPRDRDNIVAMAYLSCEHVPPGQYTLELNVLCSDVNRGRHRTDLLIPSRYAAPDLSDIALLRPNVPTGENVQPGIVRDTNMIYADPLHVYTRNDSVYIYQEFLVPQSPRAPKDFLIRVTAFPQTSGKGGRDRAVDVGGIVDVQDTLGNPWGTVRRASDVPAADNEQPPDARELYSMVLTPAAPRYIFTCTVSTKKLRRTDYWLQISITDPREERFFRTALTQFTVQ